MKCTLSQFRSHFSDYADRFFILKENNSWTQLNDSELTLLNQYGLPDSGLPFFHFDFTLQYTRDIDLEDAIFVLGSALDVTSPNYIYINKEHHVRVIDEYGNDHFLNSSLESMYEYLYLYSTWLESIEHRSQIMGHTTVESDEIFDIYYELRSIDKQGMTDDSIWYQIVKAELHIDADPAEVL